MLQNILIDILTVSEESVAFLEQAADVTGGTFIRCTNEKLLSQIMLVGCVVRSPSPGKHRKKNWKTTVRRCLGKSVDQ